MSVIGGRWATAGWLVAVVLLAGTATVHAQSDPGAVPNEWYQCQEASGPDFSNVVPGYIGFMGCTDGNVYVLSADKQTHTMNVWVETQQAMAAGSPPGSLTTWSHLPVNVTRFADNSVSMISFAFWRADLSCDMYLSQGNGDSLNCHGSGAVVAPPVPTPLPAPAAQPAVQAVPPGNQGSVGEQQYNTKNGLQTVYSMTVQLQNAGYNGPTDPASVIAAYSQSTGGPVTPNGTISGSP